MIGHSERRQWFGEPDEVVAKKLATALNAGLHPLFCVGETLPERDENRVEEILERQLRKGLGNCSLEDLSRVVIAYEPVWAIGTGRTATAAQAREAHAFIRSVVARLLIQRPRRASESNTGAALSRKRQELMRLKDVDGALVGGASLDPCSFAQIVRGALKKD